MDSYSQINLTKPCHQKQTHSPWPKCTPLLPNEDVALFHHSQFIMAFKW